MIFPPNDRIEHTNLSFDLKEEDLVHLINEAKAYHFFGICVPPFWVKKCRRDLEDHNLKLTTVIGFPFGYQKTETKLREIDSALEDGADELDIVPNFSAYQSGLKWFKTELAKCCSRVHENEKIIKVILESEKWSRLELSDLVKMSCDAGVDYIKTSTGVLGKGANPEVLKFIRKTAPDSVGIKASGGIRTWNQFRELVDIGADRIGTSSGIEIIKEFERGRKNR